MDLGIAQGLGATWAEPVDAGLVNGDLATAMPAGGCAYAVGEVKRADSSDRMYRQIQVWYFNLDEPGFSSVAAIEGWATGDAGGSDSSAPTGVVDLPSELSGWSGSRLVVIEDGLAEYPDSSIPEYTTRTSARIEFALAADRVDYLVSASTGETTTADPSQEANMASAASGVRLPDLLVEPGVNIRTGGKYVDADGYTARVDVTVYNPVGLDGDVSQLLELCPAQVAAAGASSIRDAIETSNLKTDGGIAAAFEVKITSPDADFPFPLDQLLAIEAESISAHPDPYLTFTDDGLDPSLKYWKTCTLETTGSSGSWIGYGALLPEDVSTPNNPDGTLPDTDLSELTLSLREPLHEVADDLESPWMERPATDYGPLLGTGWIFTSDIAPFRDRFTAGG